MSKHRRPTHSRRRAGLAAAALGVAALTMLGASAPAMAAKGGGTSKPSGGGKHQTSYTGSFSLRLLDSTDGQAHYGQKITFDVVTNAQYYFVEVDCSQNGTQVYAQSEGMYPGWPWSKDFTLASLNWTGGAADCSARLYSSSSDGSNQQTMATMTFPVAA